MTLSLWAPTLAIPISLSLTDGEALPQFASDLARTIRTLLGQYEPTNGEELLSEFVFACVEYVALVNSPGFGLLQPCRTASVLGSLALWLFRTMRPTSRRAISLAPFFGIDAFQVMLTYTLTSER